MVKLLNMVLIILLVFSLLCGIAGIGLSWPVFFAGPRGGADKKICIVLRYDDYSAHSSTDLEAKIIRALAKFNLVSTFSVIPFDVPKREDPNPQQPSPIPPQKIALLKEAIQQGLVQVSQHGKTHHNIKRHREGWMTEFSTLDLDTQRDLIAQGKRALEGTWPIQIKSFIPPWDNYDTTTIRALELLGFETLSPELFRPSLENSTLKILPKTIHINQIIDAVGRARRSGDQNPLLIVLYHEYDFEEVDGFQGIVTVPGFEKILEWLSSQKDITVLTVDQAAKIVPDLSPQRFQKNNLYRNLTHHLSKVLPDRLISRYYAGGLYLSQNLALRLTSGLILMTLFCYALALSLLIAVWNVLVENRIVSVDIARLKQFLAPFFQKHSAS